MLVESKSNLARLMATENLFVEQRNVATASFDVKNRILTVPILSGNLSDALIDLLLGHEVGHALETPEKGWHDSIIDLKVNRSILNVCEDARIEKKIKRKFPGIRISFVKGYRELLEMNFFGVKDKDLNTLNFIDRINLYTKGGAVQNIDFTQEEFSMLYEVEAAEEFEETVKIAIKIQNFMKEQEKSNPQKKKKSDTEKTSDESSQSPSDFNFDEESDDSKDSNEGEDGEEGEDSKEGSIKKTKSSKEMDEDGSGSEGSSATNVESETDKSFRRNEEKLYDENVKIKSVIYSNIPEIILDNVIISHEKLIQDIEEFNQCSYNKESFRPEIMKANFNKFRTESNKVVSYLVKEFEMRKNAEQQARASVSKTGELNMSKIHEYKFSDDIFARLTKVPNGKSHGLVMFIDWSGSMYDHMSSTVKQLLNLVMFCKKVNIPFEVYAFSTYTMNQLKKQTVQKDIVIQKLKIGDLYSKPFTLLNILSHRMSSNDFNKMSSYLLDFGTGRRHMCSNMEPPESMRLSGTPLNEAVISAFKLVPEFRKKNKLEIVNTVFLTDGEGSAIHGRLNAIDGAKFQTISVDSTNQRRNFFRDPVTKASIEILPPNDSYNSSRANQTTALLKLLKQRTESNIIGFYIATGRDIRSALSSYFRKPEDPTKPRNDDIEDHMMNFRKNNFTYLNNAGYDEYYLLRSDKLDTDDEEEFQVSSTTTRSLVNAFSKYTSSRISKRIVLNRFINLIA